MKLARIYEEDLQSEEQSSTKNTTAGGMEFEDAEMADLQEDL